jgi:ATP-dependent DNA ligase
MVSHYSRRGNGITKRFDCVAEAPQSLPDKIVIDREVVAIDEQGSRASTCSITSAQPHRTSRITHPRS